MGEKMKKRKLGNTQFEISEVGLGCWQFGGDFGPMEDDTAQSIMYAAVENGITFFDTADVYGAGKSENLIGWFLKETDQEITIATKFGRNADVFPDNYTKEKLRNTVTGSLQRLGVERIDLLQLHCVPIDILRHAEIFEWLRQIQTDGLIKNFGASVESVEEALICLEHEDLVSLQVIFNIFRQKLITDLFPIAKAKNVGIIVRLPVASGLLAGKFTKSTNFVETDHRNFNRDGQLFNVGETFAGLSFDKGVELADELKTLLPEGMSLLQMALRWILDFDAVSVIIPGASSAKQARENAAVSKLPPLNKQLHSQLTEFYKNHVHDHIRGPY
jgi:aryl-alcohol dehydrogenase-like predicted oxidoreductase